MSQIIIAWFSCGITSAVACKIALQTYKDVVLYYTDTGSQEEDSLRFLPVSNGLGKKSTLSGARNIPTISM